MEIKTEIDDKVDLGIVKEEFSVVEEKSQEYPTLFLEIETKAIKKESEDSDNEESSKNHHDCRICGKNFNNASALERHRDWHDPEGSASCLKDSKSSRKKLSPRKKLPMKPKIKKFSCSHCPRSYSSPSGLRYHLKAISRAEEKYECAECNKKYLEKSFLKNHIVTVHLRKVQQVKGKRGRKPKNPDIPNHPGPYMCETCGASLKTKASYERHLFVHTDVKDVQCPLCGKMFACKQYLGTHMLMHTKRGGYICTLCNKAYNSRGGLLYHKKYAHSVEAVGVQEVGENGQIVCKPKRKKNECEKCGMKFVRKSQVEKHFLEVHLGISKGSDSFVCEQCGKVLKTKASYERHQYVHSTTKDIMCPVCGKMFSCKEYLGVHMLNHRDKNSYTCEVCKKAFSRTGFRYHRKHAHKEKNKKLIDNFQCAKCKMIFPKKQKLKNHLLRQHFKSPEFVHICATCGKSFNTKGGYDRHQFVHTDIKSIMCPYCGKMFSCKQYLSTHMLMHTKRGGYVCETCNKAYNSRGGLLHHKRSVHSGIGFSCPFCEKTLTSKGSLRNHIKSHHTEIPAEGEKGKKRKRTRKIRASKAKSAQTVESEQQLVETAEHELAAEVEVKCENIEQK
ncbi:gastrula zinc finger protein XlCGF26.1-like [Lutzomyia longipalpis]|uniref:gastrula zinc finger protein XlCGF26.1-like n=1 Tax=Lutzomyia longipalpis TaxID=7200 RepID=UPI002483C20E|nr:gastrula zinc finger protein XlCGF26.1-like [Lutzomyia longipalpis]